jgi:hypothetical protein
VQLFVKIQADFRQLERINKDQKWKTTRQTGLHVLLGGYHRQMATPTI